MTGLVKTIFCWRVLVVTLLVIALGGCASVDQSPCVNGDCRLAPRCALSAEFDVFGRLSVRNEKTSTRFSFHWLATQGNEQIAIYDPFGGQRARIDITPDMATLTLADGSQSNAANAQALFDRYIQLPLPVSNLALWLQGYPSSNGRITQQDAGGRALQFGDNGWLVQIGAYDNTGRPSNISAEWAEKKLRVIVDEWRSPPCQAAS